MPNSGIQIRHVLLFLSLLLLSGHLPIRGIVENPSEIPVDGIVAQNSEYNLHVEVLLREDVRPELLGFGERIDVVGWRYGQQSDVLGFLQEHGLS